MSAMLLQLTSKLAQPCSQLRNHITPNYGEPDSEIFTQGLLLEMLIILGRHLRYDRHTP